MSKLRCWPGCRAEIISGANKGAIVAVLERAPDYFGYALWHVVSLSGPLLVRVGPCAGQYATVGAMPDDRLRPLPDLDDPQTVETVEEMVA
ncbi:MAG: hypothetical protein KF822_09625 [Steroidobacteraceae bacterium]|nr:hypothetical protein [Steroidobacteraceae bacterium]